MNQEQYQEARGELKLPDQAPGKVDREDGAQWKTTGELEAILKIQTVTKMCKVYNLKLYNLIS